MRRQFYLRKSISQRRPAPVSSSPAAAAGRVDEKKKEVEDSLFDEIAGGRTNALKRSAQEKEDE